MSVLPELLAHLYANDGAYKSVIFPNACVCDVVVASLSDALKVNKIVALVDLSSNAIGPAGCAALCEVLHMNRSITSLDLRQNLLDTASIDSLRVAAESNNVIREIFVGGNRLASKEAQHKLQTILLLNRRPEAFKRLVVGLPTSKDTVIDFSLPAPTFRDASSATSGEPEGSPYLDDWCVTVLAERLAFNSVVKTLRLCNHHIRDAGASALAKMLETNTGLDEVDLFGNAISREGVLAFIDALAHNNSIRKLNLLNNICSDGTLVELAEAVSINNQPLRLKKYIPAFATDDPTLTEIDFDEHESQRFYGDVSAKFLCQCLVYNTHLAKLSLANNHISEAGCVYLGELLQRNSGLATLNLSGNPLGSEGIGYLAEGLRTNNSLTTLILQCVGVPEEGFRALCDAFYGEAPVNNMLETLDLRDTKTVTDSVAGIFIRGYRKDLTRKLHNILVDGTTVSHRLRTELINIREMRTQPVCLRNLLNDPPENLSLVDCKLTDNNINILTSLLRTNPTVTTVDLTHNNIGPEGMKRIVEALCSNRYCVKDLNLTGNHVGRAMGSLMLQLIAQHCVLSRINLSSTGIDATSMTELALYFSANGRRIKQFITSEKHFENNDYQNQIDLYLKCHVVPSIEFKARTKELNDKLISMASSLAGTDEKRFGGAANSEIQQQKKLSVAFAVYANYVNSKDLNDISLGHGSPGISFDNALLVVKHLGIMYPRLFQHYTAFLFPGNCLTDASAPFLEDLFPTVNELTHIDLSNNQFTDAAVQHIVKLVQTCSKVVRVDLEGNHISAKGLEEVAIAVSFNRLPAFAMNIISEIRAGRTDILDLCNDSIHQNLTDRDVHHIFDALTANPRVRYVNISHNHINNDGLAALFRAVKSHPSVHTIIAMNLLIQDGDAVGQLVADLLRNNSTVRVIDMSYNELSDACGQRVLEALRVNKTVSKIEFKGCGLANDTLLNLSSTLSLNSNQRVRTVCESLEDLEVVDLGNSRLDDIQVRVLLQAMASSRSKKIHSVLLNNNSLSDDSSALLFGALRHCQCLTFIDLSYNRLSTATALALGEFLQTNVTVRRVLLSHNLIDNPGARGLLGVAATNRTLHELDTQGNLITEDGFADKMNLLLMNQLPSVRDCLQSILNSDPHFTRLEVNFSYETHHTEFLTQSYCKALLYNTSVQSLQFIAPVLSSQCLQSILDMCHVNTSITSLKLQGNLTDGSASTISSMLRVNKALKSVDLSSNDFSNASTSAFESLFIFNSTLRELNLSGNKIEHAHMQQVQSLVDINDQFDGFKELVHRVKENDPYTTVIDVSERQINDIACGILSRALWENTSVKALRMARSSVTKVGALQLLRLFKHNPTVEEWDFSGSTNLSDVSDEIVDFLMYHSNSMRDVKCENCNFKAWTTERILLLCRANASHVRTKHVVVSLLKKDPSLKTVDLSDLGLCDAPLSSICQLLATDMICTKLDISNNRIGREGIQALVKMFHVNAEGILELNLSGNKSVGEFVHELCVQGPASLTHADLSSCNVPDTAVESLKSWLIQRHKLIALRLDNNPSISRGKLELLRLYVRMNKEHAMLRSLLHQVIADSSAKSMDCASFMSQGAWRSDSTEVVCATLEASPHVTSVDLSFNDLELPHIKLFAQVIKSPLCSITHINLCHNLLQDISNFAAALEVNQTITTLNMSHNNMRISSAKDLARCIRTNTVLTCLEVEHQKWGDTGAKVLLEALRDNKSLVALDVEGPEVAAPTVDDIKYFLLRRVKQAE